MTSDDSPIESRAEDGSPRPSETDGDSPPPSETDGDSPRPSETDGDSPGPFETDGSSPLPLDVDDDSFVAFEAGLDHGEFDHADEKSGLLRRIAIVAVQEYRLSIRNQWALALTGLFTFFAVLLTAFSGSSVGPESFAPTVLSLASLATYLLPLAALAYGFDTIVGADEDRWLDVMFALPLRRSDVVFGKYFGRAFTLGVATVIGFSIAGVLLVSRTGLANAVVYLKFMFTAAGVGWVFLSISVLISTLASEKTHALGLSLLAWVWFVLIYDLLALGAIATLDVPGEALSVLVLSNPADVFRVIILTGMNTTAGGFAAIYADTGLSMAVLVGTLIVWGIVPLALAARLVRRRSL